MSRAATLEIVELYRTFIIKFIDAFRIEIILVREVRALGFTPMQNPKMRALFGGPFPCVALVHKVRVVREVRVMDLALLKGKHAYNFCLILSFAIIEKKS